MLSSFLSGNLLPFVLSAVACLMEVLSTSVTAMTRVFNNYLLQIFCKAPKIHTIVVSHQVEAVYVRTRNSFSIIPNSIFLFLMCFLLSVSSEHILPNWSATSLTHANVTSRKILTFSHASVSTSPLDAARCFVHLPWVLGQLGLFQ